jgi:hypothetical protein
VRDHYGNGGNKDGDIISIMKNLSVQAMTTIATDIKINSSYENLDIQVSQDCKSTFKP